MPFTNVAQCVVQGTMNEVTTINVLHFASVGAVPPDVHSSLDDLNDNVHTAVVQTLLPAVSGEFELREVRSKQLHPIATDEAVLVPNGMEVGLKGIADPSFVAALISFRTGLGGRSHRGRMYIAGVDQDDTQFSTLTPASQVLYKVFADRLLTDFGPAVADPNWKLIVFSQKNFKLTPNNPDTYCTQVTRTLVNQRIASMVSRKVGRGA